jgi:hypothetical protein
LGLNLQVETESRLESKKTAPWAGFRAHENLGLYHKNAFLAHLPVNVSSSSSSAAQMLSPLRWARCKQRTMPEVPKNSPDISGLSLMRIRKVERAPSGSVKPGVIERANHRQTNRAESTDVVDAATVTSE